MPQVIVEEFEERGEIIPTKSSRSDGTPGRLERVASRLLMGLVFLLPVFFIPALSFPVAGSKETLFFLVLLFAFALLAISRLKSGTLSFPFSPTLVALSALALAFLLSALFSSAPLLSFMGQGGEVGGALFIIFASLLVFLTLGLIQKREQIFGCYIAFLSAFFLLALFHLLRLIFGPDFLSFGIFTNSVFTPLGKWNDLGIFFGASALFSLITLEFLPLTRFFRSLIWGTLVIALFFVAVVNFPLLWYLLGVFALVFLVFRSFSGLKTSRISIPAVVTLLISVLFIIGGTLGTSLATYFNTSSLEARPSFSTTLEVVKHALKAHPLLGVGPNRFVNEWLAWKPLGVNETVFWNTDFENGYGLLPTFLGTVGILGAAAWLVFFLLLFYTGFRAILKEGRDLFSRYTLVSSFFVALFLFVFSFFYIPSQSILALAFLFTGLFLAALSAEGELPWRTVLFTKNPRSGFLSVLALIILLIGIVTLGYFISVRYLASIYFQRGVVSWNRDGNIDDTEAYLLRATSLAPADTYFRGLAELALSRMNTLLQGKPDALSTESARTDFQNFLGSALAAAQQSVALNSLQYQNFLELGRVYEAVVPLKITGAYESAQKAYQQAQTLNPQGPATELILARLEIAHGDHAAAREHIAKALAQKSNYLEAVFLLSQLQLADGDLKSAIQSAEAAAFIAPNDPTVLFQLGLLRFNNKDYAGAVVALERAVATTPAYANAKYFLGLSYDKVGRRGDALIQFEDLQKNNPDNAEIEAIVANLQAGKPIGTPAAAKAPPEKQTLPVLE